jgi:HSP20 family protein
MVFTAPVAVCGQAGCGIRFASGLVVGVRTSRLHRFIHQASKGVSAMLVLNRFPLNPITSELDEIFDNVFSASARNGSRATGFAPAMNVWEDAGSYRIEAELPGMAMSDVEVTVLENDVTIKGERAIAEPGEGTFLRRERRGGSFGRTFTLPLPVDAEKVEASLKDGVLHVTLPKAAKALPRKIEVKAN